MRITINLDDDLLRRAAELTGIEGKSALVRAGLEAVIARECGSRLALLGGTQPQLEDFRRRRSAPKRSRRKE